jgi:regulatory protein
MTFEIALHKAAALCSTGEKCEYDIREKLQSWGVSSEDEDKIIERLVEEKFLDENRFAQSFAKDKFRFNKWGKIKIAYALRQKQISSLVIQEALENIEDEEYMNLLIDILKAKQKSTKFKDENDRQQKLFRFAQSRGFEGDLIFKVIRSL